MAVWLTHGPCTVGVDDGLIRAADFARLTDSAAVAAAIAGERERVLAQAREDAAALLAAAQAQAHALVAEADHRLAQARDSGLSQGLQDAAAQWAGQALAAADARRRQLLRQSERMATIVSMAVERVIDVEDRAGLYRRSLRTIVKLVRDTPLLTLRVTEADRVIAQGAVDAIKAQLNDLPIEVVADASMIDGGCRFESDGGVIDASLDTQLAALRRAVDRAVRQMAQDAAAEADDADAAPALPVDWPAALADEPDAAEHPTQTPA